MPDNDDDDDQQLHPDILASIERATNAQVGRSREEFENWFEAIMTLDENQPDPQWPLELWKAMIKSMRRLCWYAWYAREAKIAKLMLKAAALRKVIDQCESLENEIERLQTENRQLRHTIDNVA